MDALTLHRLQFAFTITYHYLFPQLTMGLALLIVILKTMYLRSGAERYNTASRFWAKIFGISFVFGVVTGIPMEFQFGTNWARFSSFAGGVIGQTLAMEGTFAFFLESAFLGLFLYGEKRLGRIGHWVSALLVFIGSWLSGYFIIATNAWMQHPVAYSIAENGAVHVNDFWGLLFNTWAFWQYLHNMGGALLTGAFAMAAVGAFYLLRDSRSDYGRLFLRLGVVAAFIGSIWQVFPTGDQHGQLLAKHQPVTLAAMEGHFRTEAGAGLAIVGQPNVETMTLDNPLHVPRVLSFLTYRRWDAEVKGLEAFPRDTWPDNIALLYYSYHIMVGLGTIFIAVTSIAMLQLVRKKLETSRWLLWLLMLSFPFPFIANTAGWLTAELGRQPWLAYGLLRTADGSSLNVSSGNTLFSLLGFMGMYTVISILFVLLVWREINEAPVSDH